MTIETIIGPWFWAAVGLVLLVAEVLGAGGFLLGAGIAGLVTAAIVWLFDLSWQAQCVWYALLSVASTVAYWRFFRRSAVKTEDPLLNNRIAQLVGTKTRLIAPIISGEGRVQLNDALWSVRCEKDLLEGVMVEVIGYEGATLIVKDC